MIDKMKSDCDSAEYRNSAGGLKALAVSCIAALPFAVLYTQGVQRTVGKGDSAEFAVASYTLGIPHPSGYPLYTWLGKLFTLLPFGSVAWRVNLMSAVFAYLTLVLVFHLVTEGLLGNHKSLFTRYISGACAVVLLGLFPPFLQHATVAEVYTANAFLVILCVWLFVRWMGVRRPAYLYGASLVLGLSLGTHLSNVFLVPLFIAGALLTSRCCRRVIKSVVLLLAGA
ncbi:MAG: DUF2723 domain-containing protein, partial [Candidatus Eisenbacteria bacterium]